MSTIMAECKTHGRTEFRVDKNFHAFCKKCLEALEASIPPEQLEAALRQIARPSCSIGVKDNHMDWSTSLNVAIDEVSKQIGYSDDWRAQVMPSCNRPLVLSQIAAALWTQQVPEDRYTALIRAQLKSLSQRGAFDPAIELSPYKVAGDGRVVWVWDGARCLARFGRQSPEYVSETGRSTTRSKDKLTYEDWRAWSSAVEALYGVQIPIHVVPQWLEIPS